MLPDGRRPSNVLFFNCCLTRTLIRKFYTDVAAVRAVPTRQEAEYLNFLEALIVRFKRLWVPRASATRPGATAILSDN
ncbi:unnamed protein product, partial [Symbiodinium sp. KB8]